MEASGCLNQSVTSRLQMIRQCGWVIWWYDTMRFMNDQPCAPLLCLYLWPMLWLSGALDSCRFWMCSGSNTSIHWCSATKIWSRIVQEKFWKWLWGALGAPGWWDDGLVPVVPRYGLRPLLQWFILPQIQWLSQASNYLIWLCLHVGWMLIEVGQVDMSLHVLKRAITCYMIDGRTRCPPRFHRGGSGFVDASCLNELRILESSSIDGAKPFFLDAFGRISEEIYTGIGRINMVGSRHLQFKGSWNGHWLLTQQFQGKLCPCFCSVGRDRGAGWVAGSRFGGLAS